MTKKLYIEDQYLRKLSSAVVQKIEAGQRPGIILGQILFYPTSGGQLHDIGAINEIPVLTGHGGGRPQQAQGGGSAVDNLDAALQSADELISKG